MKSIRSRFIVPTIAFLSFTGNSGAQSTLFWTPSPLSDDWSNTVWATTSGGAPSLTWTSGDNAVFDQAGTYTATINAAQTATNINIKAGTVTFAGTNTVSSTAMTIDSGATLAGAGDRIAKSGTTQVTVNGLLDLTAGGFSGGRFIQLGGSGTVIGGFRHSGSASFSGNIQNVSPTVRAAILWNGGTGGTLTLSGNNSGMTGDVLMSIANSVIKLDSANAFSPASHLRFSGSANSNLIELAAADFTRAWFTGSNAEGNGGISWSGTNAGFYATGGDRNLTFVTTTGGSSAASVVWGSNGLTSSTVVLGAAASTHKLIWTNDINLNGGNRTINTTNGTAAVEAEISGVLSGTGASILTKTGTGVLLLSNKNTHAGGTVIAENQSGLNPLRISHDEALGTGSLTIGAGGNQDRSRLELTGGITVANSVAAMTSRNSLFPSILNISGNNTMSANLSSGGGGSHFTLQSDAGKLILSGNFSSGRRLHLAGDGDGEIQGNTNIASTYGLDKSGSGNWTLNNGNFNNTTTLLPGRSTAAFSPTPSRSRWFPNPEPRCSAGWACSRCFAGAAESSIRSNTKPKNQMKPRKNLTLPLLLCLATTTVLPAATLYWDGNDLTPDADGGAGTWDTSSTNWDDAATGGAADAWPATTSGNDDAVFGGTAATVTIDASGITANDITFTTGTYTITGGTLTLDSIDPDPEDGIPAPLPAITNAVAATISSDIIGSYGLNKIGNGTLTLSGNNAGLSGPLLVSGATSGNAGGVILSGNSALGGISSIEIKANSFLQLSGVTVAATVPVTVFGSGGTAAPEGTIRGLAGTNVVDSPMAIGDGAVRFGNVGSSTSITFNGAVTAPVDSGFGVLIRQATAQGVVFTNTSNYWEGQTQLHVGSTYFHPGALPATTLVTLANSGSAWLETNGTFARALGTSAGQIRMDNTTAGRVSGIGARGGELELNFGGAAATLTWGVTPGFNPIIFGLGSGNSTDTVTLLNPIDLNAANRSIHSTNGLADVDGEISSVISGATGSALTKSGNGVLLLSNANTHPGGTTIAQSQGVVNPLRISHANALGTGNLNIGGGGNNDQSRLELIGGITVTNAIPILTSRNNDVPNFYNVDDENTITSGINSGGGGGRVTFHSDAGNLIFTGNIATRQLNLRGEGNGELRGNVPLQAGYGLTKAGGGTWIIAGDATYPGTTVISGGTLQIGSGGTTGTLPAGDVTNNSTLVFNRDGSLSVAAKISGAGNLIKRGPGELILTAGVLDHTGTTSIEEGRLVINGDAGDATGTVNVGNGIGDPASAILGGAGVVGGNITIATDGAVAPGTSAGDLLVLGDVAGSGSLEIEIDGAVGDSLTLQGGTLDITNLILDVSALAAPTVTDYVIVNADSPIAGAAFAAVNGLPSGYSVVYGYNDGNDIHNIAIVGTPSSDPFDTWATTTHGLAGGDALPGADPDNDGISNLIEFVIGGQPNPANPNAASNTLAPTIAVDATHLVFTFRRTALSATQPGLSVVVEYGSDLSGWSVATDGIGGVSVTPTTDGFGSGVDRIDVAIPRSLVPGEPLFARLRAVIPD
jgi:autotransporter-associated beta strand protein